MVLGGGAVSYERGTPVSGDAESRTQREEGSLDRAERAERRGLTETVKLIPTVKFLFPRGGPVQDPVLKVCNPSKQRDTRRFEKQEEPSGHEAHWTVQDEQRACA